MGLERSVTFPGGTIPAWAAVSDLLARHHFAVQMRMINGELAFPDESPPDDWREVRVASPAGMVTLRREADRVRLVVWGNADAALTNAWNALTWAIAEAGGGQIETQEGSLSPAAFRRGAAFPAGWAGDG